MAASSGECTTNEKRHSSLSEGLIQFQQIEPISLSDELARGQQQKTRRADMWPAVPIHAAVVLLHHPQYELILLPSLCTLLKDRSRKILVRFFCILLSLRLTLLDHMIEIHFYCSPSETLSVLLLRHVVEWETVTVDVWTPRTLLLSEINALN